MLTACLGALFLVQTPDADGGDTYRPDWSSLQTRTTPQWWRDAKFGIFIHWGIYSVPSYSPIGTYAEWYWERMNHGVPERDGDPRIDMPNSDRVRDFHMKNFGADFNYREFAPLFRAELFDPSHWADLLKRSGARYVVLVSKHHDGFALWPSEEASRSWGRPWNANEIGPKRDLLGDLTEAVRRAGLRMGFYYSLYEWYNPIYLRDVRSYVEQHMHPQFKDLVTRYGPSVIFADGEWSHPSSTWKSEELLAWLYNRPESAEVAVNDRWGAETRHKLGGYYTTEYGAGLPDAKHPWEESRGIGTSYGYNRLETIDDYSTAQRLILTLVDTVSRGGNFLLNIGPTADGRIPVVMEDRLLAIGRWLSTNGEAIYGTTAWEQGAAQWGEGKIPETRVAAHGFVDYDIIQQTITPLPEQARKEIFFTRRPNFLYAITPLFPRDALLIKGLVLNDRARIDLLGAGEKFLPWRQTPAGVLIDVSGNLLRALEAKEAFTFRISLAER